MIRPTPPPPGPISRRSFLGHAVLASAAAALASAGGLPGSGGWLAAARAATPDLVHDTVNGLLAFVVPGSDAYSVAQGTSTPEPGGVEAGVTDVLIATLDETTPFVPAFSATVAAVLDGFAQAVNPGAVDAVTGLMPVDTGSTRGPGSGGRLDVPGVGMLEVVGETPGLRAGLSAFSDAGIPGFYDNGLPGGAHGADIVGRLVGRDLKEAMAHVDRLLNIDVFTDDDEAQNGVTLSSTLPPDEHGSVPRIEIHHRGRVRAAEAVGQRRDVMQLGGITFQAGEAVPASARGTVQVYYTVVDLAP